MNGKGHPHVERPWDKFLTETDQQVASVSGYGALGGLGRSPALLVIDVNYNFCGPGPKPLPQAAEAWRNSCGTRAWDAVEHIRQLIDAARDVEVPVLYSTNETPRLDGVDSGRWASKNTRRLEDAAPERAHGNDVVERIAPERGDLVIRKTKPSVFYGTPLVSHLVELGVDTLICCGGTTSGCVRATVVDAFSRNFYVGIPEEACFDRYESSHWMSLFDLHQKYADVLPAREILTYLGSRSTNGQAGSDRAGDGHLHPGVGVPIESPPQPS